MAEIGTYEFSPRRLYQAGERVFGPVAIPDAAQKFTARLHRADFNDADDSRMIVMSVEWSTDNGATWISGGSVGAPLCPPPWTADYTWFRGNIPSGSGRLVRATIVVPDGGARFAATVVLDDEAFYVPPPAEHHSVAYEALYPYDAGNVYQFTSGAYGNASSDIFITCLSCIQHSPTLDATYFSRSSDEFTMEVTETSSQNSKTYMLSSYNDGASKTLDTSSNALTVSNTGAYAAKMQLWVFMLSGADVTGTPIGATDTDYASSDNALSMTVAASTGDLVCSVISINATGKTPTCSGADGEGYDNDPGGTSAYAYEAGATSVTMAWSWAAPKSTCAGCTLVVQQASDATQAVAGAASGTGVAAGTLRVDARLVGAASGTGVLAGTLKVRAPLAGAASGTGVAAGSLTLKAVEVAGAATGAGVAAGALTVEAHLAGAASGTGVMAGALAVSAPLAGAASGTGVASGAMLVSATLAGAASGTGVAAGAITLGAIQLAGAAAGTGTAAGALTVSAPLAGAASGSGTTAGSMKVTAPLAGAASGTGVAAGSLTATLPSGVMAGAAAGTGVAAGTLTVTAPLAGAASGTGVASGSIHVRAPLAGAGTGTGVASGRVTTGATSAVLAGAAEGTGVASGALRVTAPLLGAAGGSGTAVGSLFVMPGDRDTDVTVTARTDLDGATIRPARATVLHAVNSCRNADLIGPDRTALDRYLIRSRRTGRLPNVGQYLRLLVFSGRAGEAFSPSTISVSLSGTTPRARFHAADTTSRTDLDGATMTVCTVRALHASDSQRNADLSTVGTDSDRFRATVTLPVGTRAYVNRLLLVADGRAGSVFSVKDFSVLASVVGQGQTKARAY